MITSTFDRFVWFHILNQKFQKKFNCNVTISSSIPIRIFLIFKRQVFSIFSSSWSPTQTSERTSSFLIETYLNTSSFSVFSPSRRYNVATPGPESGEQKQEIRNFQIHLTYLIIHQFLERTLSVQFSNESCFRMAPGHFMNFVADWHGNSGAWTASGRQLCSFN